MLPSSGCLYQTVIYRRLNGDYTCQKKEARPRLLGLLSLGKTQVPVITSITNVQPVKGDK